MGRSTRVGRLIGIAAPLLLLLVACSAATPQERVAQPGSPETTAEPPRGLDAEGLAAWQKWRGLELDSYRYRLGVGCECFTVNDVIEVRDDKVVTVGGKPYNGTGKRAGLTGFYDVDPTIDGLFVQLGEAMERADQVDVEYDPDTGVPTQISVDWMKNAIDDEIGYTATPPQSLSSS